MFTAKMLTAPTGFLLAMLACGCTYVPASSGKAADVPEQRAARSIEDAAALVKGQLARCGSISSNHHDPVIGWREASWKLASATGCAWQFEYSEKSYGYSHQDSSSG